jgi:hypothetical protein
MSIVRIDKIDETLDLLNLESINFGILIDIASNCQDIISECEWIKMHIPDITDLVVNAYGIRTNPYEHVGSILYYIDALETCAPALTTISNMRAFKNTRFISPSRDECKEYLEKIKDAAEKINQIIENKYKIFEAALRFDETSKYMKRLEHGDGSQYLFLDYENLKQLTYRLVNFTWYKSETRVVINEESAETWPVLRELFPEEFV